MTLLPSSAGLFLKKKWYRGILLSLLSRKNRRNFRSKQHSAGKIHRVDFIFVVNFKTNSFFINFAFLGVNIGFYLFCRGESGRCGKMV